MKQILEGIFIKVNLLFILLFPTFTFKSYKSGLVSLIFAVGNVILFKKIHKQLQTLQRAFKKLTGKKFAYFQ